MKLKNNGIPVLITFASKEHNIPSGEFEVFDEKLGYFILEKAMKWGLDIAQVGEKKTEDIRPDIISKKEEVQTPEEIVKAAEAIIVEAKSQMAPKVKPAKK
jgi:hypothetical protein